MTSLNVIGVIDVNLCDAVGFSSHVNVSDVTLHTCRTKIVHLFHATSHVCDIL